MFGVDPDDPEVPLYVDTLDGDVLVSIETQLVTQTTELDPDDARALADDVQGIVDDLRAAADEVADHA